MEIIVYHGTDAEGAKSILQTGAILGDGKPGGFGPGLCTDINAALNYSAIKCSKYGAPIARRRGRIIELKVDSSVLDNADLDREGAYTLNDEFGRPRQSFPVNVDRVSVYTIPQAQTTRKNSGR